MKTKTMTTLHLRKSIGRSPCRGALLLIPLAIAATFAEAVVAAPSPGVVAGGFCTYRTGYLSTSTQAAQWINTYFAAGSVGSEIFHVGNVETPTDDPTTYAYTWRKTGTPVPVGKGRNAVLVDSGVAALGQAVQSGGRPRAFSTNATNPTDMGTGGILGSQALTEKVNQGFSEAFVTPATVSTFASKPTYNTFSGDVVSVSPSTGCDASSYSTFPVGKIALIERGACTFYQKVSVATQAGASAAIIFNSAPAAGCPTVPTPGANNCEALVGMGAATGSPLLPIPAAFVQRSTGVALRDGTAPVTAFVQQ